MSNFSSEKSPIAQWDEERLFFRGDDYYNEMFLCLEKAQNKVWIESYIFDLDSVGLKLLRLLQGLQARGVEVKLLVDGIGSLGSLAELREKCRQMKIDFRIYHPLPFSLQRSGKMRWRKLKLWLYLFRRINKRNHRKVVLIDDSMAFLGSYNISQVHSEKIMGPQTWVDTGVFVRGSDVRGLHDAFLKAWLKSKYNVQVDAASFLKLKAKTRPQSLIRLNSKMRWRYQLLRDLNRKMKQAQKRILITNAYFLPRKSILRNLRKAAKRGVFVGLCLPAKSDVWFVKAAAKSLYSRLLKDGVHIFEYQPQILHSKILIIDDWATVGSHNLNHRSLSHDLEAEAVITDPLNLQLLIQDWDQKITKSKAIGPTELGRWGLIERALSRFAYWFRYWI